MDTIGSSYTTSANMLRIQTLFPHRKKKYQSECLDKNGKLQYPPKLPKMVEKKPAGKTAAQRHRPGVVKLAVSMYAYIYCYKKFYNIK